MKQMKRAAKSWLAMTIIVLLSAMAAYAQATSRVISFSGLQTTLTPGTTQALTVQLWDDAAAGTLIVSEDQPAVSVDDAGRISFRFGSVLGGLNPDHFPSDASRFLDVIDPGTGTSVLSGGRIALNATAFALSASNAAVANGLSAACVNCVTSGQIQNVAGSQVTGAIAGSQISGAIPVESVPAGSGNYIQNAAAVQQDAGFNISRDGMIGGNMIVNGQAGIGIDAPRFGHKLDVNGSAIISPGGINPHLIQFGTPNFETGMTISATNRADIRFDGSALKLVAVTGNSGPPPSTNGIAIDTAGNVGIGTASPLAGVKLDVVGNTRMSIVNRTINFGTPNAETGMTIIGTSRADFRFDDNTLKLVAGPAGGTPPSTNGIAINTAGNVGIGTTAPTTKLHVVGTARASVLEITGGSDLAEHFEVVEEARPGMVVAIDPQKTGKLALARGAYNRRVAGIISGANNLSAGMVLPDLAGAKQSMPMALSGRVWVYCDATKNAIKPGDLLTTSATPGHAMKVTNHAKAQGAIIGKAMTELKSGRGLVLVLVTLQ